MTSTIAHTFFPSGSGSLFFPFHPVDIFLSHPMIFGSDKVGLSANWKLLLLPVQFVIHLPNQATHCGRIRIIEAIRLIAFYEFKKHGASLAFRISNAGD